MANLADKELVKLLSTFPQFIAQMNCAHGTLCTFSAPGKKLQFKQGPSLVKGCGSCNFNEMRDYIVEKGKWEPYNQPKK